MPRLGEHPDALDLLLEPHVKSARQRRIELLVAVIDRCDVVFHPGWKTRGRRVTPCAQPAESSVHPRSARSKDPPAALRPENGASPSDRQLLRSARTRRCSRCTRPAPGMFAALDTGAHRRSWPRWRIGGRDSPGPEITRQRRHADSHKRAWGRSADYDSPCSHDIGTSRLGQHKDRRPLDAGERSQRGASSPITATVGPPAHVVQEDEGCGELRGGKDCRVHRSMHRSRGPGARLVDQVHVGLLGGPQSHPP